MRVHHLNRATPRPLSQRLVNGVGSPLRPARLVCHCLLVETGDGLLLVDSGIGLGAATDPQAWLGRPVFGTRWLRRPVPGRHAARGVTSAVDAH